MRTLFPKRGTTAYNLLRSLLHDYQDEERPCAQDPELWWMTDHPSVQEAKKRCQGLVGNGTPCPLLETCGLYAVVAVEPLGVWGGLSPDDRTAIRRRRTKARQRANKRAERARKAAAEAATEPLEGEQAS